jgi:hypothetical protein
MTRFSAMPLIPWTTTAFGVSPVASVTARVLAKTHAWPRIPMKSPDTNASICGFGFLSSRQTKFSSPTALRPLPTIKPSCWGRGMIDFNAREKKSQPLRVQISSRSPLGIGPLSTRRTEANQIRDDEWDAEVRDK